jgi:hypothetical protein
VGIELGLRENGRGGEVRMISTILAYLGLGWSGLMVMVQLVAGLFS